MRKKTAPANKSRKKVKGLSKFARSLLQEWKRLGLPATRETVVVAVSGGADSVALLMALEELVKAKRLRVRISVAHLDHNLRKDSHADARWVYDLTKRLGLEVSLKTVDVAHLAKKSRDNLEQAARRARYSFLLKFAARKGYRVVVTAHTMDDQAETVLLNLLRGSGLDGLGGIEPSRAFDESPLLLARPLVSWALRQDTTAYCEHRGIEYRVDEMNLDESFSRVRIRRQLLPLMESFNPRIVDALSRTATLLREDNKALDVAAGRLLELSIETDPKGKACSSLRYDLLVHAQPALRRRALRLWLKHCRGHLRRVERVHILAVESLLLSNRGGRIIELPGGATVYRKRGLLHFVTKP